jgi:hypothetical protein
MQYPTADSVKNRIGTYGLKSNNAENQVVQKLQCRPLTEENAMKTKATLASESNGTTNSVSKGSLWAGRIISALSALFMLMDAVMKLVKPAFVVEATVQLGYRESVIFGLGLVLLVCVILYVVPRTSILGALLLTGYLGGAVATNLRVGLPLFSHILFPIYVAVLLWGGLILREPRLRALFPLRQD